MKKRQEIILEAAQQKADLINSVVKHPSIKAIEEMHDLLVDQCSQAGREDGRRGIPSFESEHSSFEAQVAAQYKAAFIRRSASEKGLLAQLESRRRALREEFVQTDAGQLWQEAHDIEQQFSRVKISSRRLDGETDAVRKMLQYGSAFLAAYLLLSLCEAPFTRGALEALGMSSWGALLLSGAVTLGVAGLAHMAGKSIKQWGASSKARPLAFLSLLIILLYIPILGYFRGAVALARNNAAAPATTAADMPLSNPGEELRRLDLTEVIQSHHFLVTIGAMLVMVGMGMGIGFTAHDSHPSFEAAYTDYHFRRPKVLKAYSQAREQNEREARVLGVEDPLSRILAELRRLQELTDTLRSHLYDFANYTDAMCRAAIGTYRNCNRQERTCPEELPIYWNYAPQRYIDPEEALAAGE